MIEIKLCFISIIHRNCGSELTTSVQITTSLVLVNNCVIDDVVAIFRQFNCVVVSQYVKLFVRWIQSEVLLDYINCLIFAFAVETFIVNQDIVSTVSVNSHLLGCHYSFVV